MGAVNLLMSQIALMDFQAARYLVEGQVPKQVGNDHPTFMPTSAYPTRDGWVNIGVAGQPIWERCAHALGHPEWITRPEFTDNAARSANRTTLNAVIAEVTAGRTSGEWVDQLNEAGVPSGPIYSMDQVFADPQVQHIGAAVAVPHPTLGEVRVVNQAVTLSRTPAAMARATPEHGEHTDEILRELGLDQAAIDGLRGRNVIGGTMMGGQLIVKRDGRVAWIVFSNVAKHNAVTYDMWRALPPTLRELDADPDVRVIIVTGDGEKAFISGADISQFASHRGSESVREAYNEAVEAGYRAMATPLTPTIAAVRGICYGGGLGLALACHMRICARMRASAFPLPGSGWAIRTWGSSVSWTWWGRRTPPRSWPPRVPSTPGRRSGWERLTASCRASSSQRRRRNRRPIAAGAPLTIRAAIKAIQKPWSLSRSATSTRSRR